MINDNYITLQQIEDLKNFLLIYKFAADSINTKLNILNEEYRHIHAYNPIEHIRVRIKSIDSIIEKMQRKALDINIENVNKHISDIAGIRIICSFTKDIYTLYNIMNNQDDIKVVKVKDYIKNPKPNGYKSLHMIIEVPVSLTNKVENVKVEVQIRTIAMDFWASLEHKIFYKYKNIAPSYIVDELKGCADIISLLDEKMMQLKDDIESLENK